MSKVIEHIPERCSLGTVGELSAPDNRSCTADCGDISKLIHLIALEPMRHVLSSKRTKSARQCTASAIPSR